MTTKNLVATIMAAVMSIVLLTGVRFANTQADAKSVTTPEATTVLPSTRVEDFPPPKPGSAFLHPVKVKEKKKRTLATSRIQVRKPTTVKNVVGVRASAWTGRGYDPRWENVRKCIVHRESRGNYGAKNRHSSAQGAYQFLDKFWRVPLSEKLNKPRLADAPIRTWSRVDQDRAFWLIWNHGKGKRNWALQGNQCW
jgi:hypothetical protein